jgi:diguanylate cyclase (GGDEF)-like protein
LPDQQSHQQRLYQHRHPAWQYDSFLLFLFDRGAAFFHRFPGFSLKPRPDPADEFVVISIKKYLDARDRLPDPVVDSYRTLLGAMGESGSQACPQLGLDLQASLLQLQAHLVAEMTPGDFTASGTAAEKELRLWGARTAEYYKQQTAEVKELMMLLARTVDSVGERDQRYSGQFSALSTRLRDIANLEDLAKVRVSLLQGVDELKDCVEQMSRDSNESLAVLRTELGASRSRLAETERMAAVDPLTGLANRRRIDQALDEFAARGRPFCIMMFDLNGFKSINDQLGHLAGDDLLRQFAAELRLVVRSADLAGRWGGDEFIAVLDCGLGQAESLMGRIRGWVFGEYTIRTGSEACKIRMSASIGLVLWKMGENVAETFKRADAAMFREKKASKDDQCRLVPSRAAGPVTRKPPPPIPRTSRLSNPEPPRAPPAFRADAAYLCSCDQRSGLRGITEP